MTDKVAAHFTVSGRVQGVWYRASTGDEAASLDLAGWVRNLPSGEVEVFAEGPKDAVDRLIEWCRKGPPSARVTDVKISWCDPEGYASFQVRR